jgi:gluconolactonase
MTSRSIFFAIAFCLATSTLMFGQAPAPQTAIPPCLPAPQPAPQPAPAPAQQAQAPQGPRDVTVMAIPGAVAAGAKWTKVWQTGGNNADGIIADKDGGLLVAQEDNSAVVKIDANDKASVFLPNTRRGGSLAMDRQGRLYVVLREAQPASSDPSIKAGIGLLLPDRKILADTFTDGTKLTGRPNDLAADSKGGVYFTQGCVYYAKSDGKITAVADNLRTNGIVLSPDEKTLYVTNGPAVAAFEVQANGTLTNRREFGKLEAGGNGDGSAVDADGRLYVTSAPGVQVFDKSGKYLGVIPTPRPVISVAFAGSDKKTLYVVGAGAEDASGQPIREGVQQTGRTIYKLLMIAQGYKGRAK